MIACSLILNGWKKIVDIIKDSDFEEFGKCTKQTLNNTSTNLLFTWLGSVLPRIFRVVVGFYIAFSAVYPVYT